MNTKTILITGSTDGIGLAAARALAARGHEVLLHGRNPAKLERAKQEVAAARSGGPVSAFVADLSSLKAVAQLASQVADAHPDLDVVINNAGVFNTHETKSVDGLDLRFAVNTIAPYLLSRRLLPNLSSDGRIVNLSSAAQASVDFAGLSAPSVLDNGAIYAQSKLALTMWSRALAHELGDAGPSVFAVNPGSLLATKMVKDAFGVPGKDVGIGADILVRAALSDAFDGHSGEYFDNDRQDFGPPHQDALDLPRCQSLMHALDDVLESTRPTFEG